MTSYKKKAIKDVTLAGVGDDDMKLIALGIL